MSVRDVSPVTTTPAPDFPPGRILLAWGVHLFTASGALVGVAALVAISAGDLSLAAVMMLVALFIDAVDGSMARAAHVSEVLPGFNGRRLDDMVDFFNYVLVPAVFMIGAGSVLHWAVIGFPVLASAYGFSQDDAKTEDDFFLGFPSYWNVVAMYLWLLDLPPAAGSAILVVLAGFVFVPLKYIYPSKLRVLYRTTGALSLLWLIGMVWCVSDPARAARFGATEVSLLYPIYYIGLSLWVGGWHRPAKH